jgi:hypothetical protein
VRDRLPWSARRRRTLRNLGLGAVVGGLGALALPAQYGVTAGFLAALCGFLLVAASTVFVMIPGPGTFGALLRTVPLAGASLVVAVLLLLSTTAELRWLWAVVAVAAAGWTATAIWQTRRAGGEDSADSDGSDGSAGSGA